MIQFSVIIPTYNRNQSLRETLTSLSDQTIGAASFEVVIIDDGSTDETRTILDQSYPFELNYIYQNNQGGVAARNHGAQQARGVMLVFLDDDMTLQPGYLAGLLYTFQGRTRLLVRGEMQSWLPPDSIFAKTYGYPQQNNTSDLGLFSSNNLAILKDDFFLLGGWQDVTPFDYQHRGGLWADLEFAYRAKQAGFHLVTSTEAKIVHRDYAIVSLTAAIRRARMVSYFAAPFLKVFPYLIDEIPMFKDKRAIQWKIDPPKLILRKLLREIMSFPLMTQAMIRLTLFLEKKLPNARLLSILYRWILGGIIYQGYHEGLHKFQEC